MIVVQHLALSWIISGYDFLQFPFALLIDYWLTYHNSRSLSICSSSVFSSTNSSIAFLCKESIVFVKNNSKEKKKTVPSAPIKSPTQMKCVREQKTNYENEKQVWWYHLIERARTRREGKWKMMRKPHGLSFNNDLELWWKRKSGRWD